MATVKYGTPKPNTTSIPGAPTGYGTTPGLSPVIAGNDRFRNPEGVARYQRQRQLLGPLGAAFPEGTIHRQEVPLIEQGLNEQVRQQSEYDRRRGYEELERGRSAVGTSPAQTAAREVAMARVKAAGPGGAIRSAGATTAGDMRRLASEESARRGLGGGAALYDMQTAQQSLAADIAQRAALADADYQGAALRDLMNLSQYEEAQRAQFDQAQFDQALASLFLDTERSQYDFSNLLGSDRVFGG